MKNNPFRSALLILSAFLYSLTGFPTDARETIERETIEIDFARLALAGSAQGREGRPSTSCPATGALPAALTVTLAQWETDGPQAEQATELERAVATRAAVAATWAARQQLENFGRQELYGAGFYDALQAALSEPGIGEWDYNEGARAGERDLRAAEIGSQIGLLQAKKAAEGKAFEHFEAQSHDLNPRFEPWPSTPKSMIAAPDVRQPRLLDVFDEYSLASFLKATSEDAASSGLPDPWLLYCSTGYADFYGDAWQQPAAAFDYWLSHHHDRAAWRELDRENRSRFADAFKKTYALQLNDLIQGAGERAYGRGYGAGWDYGSFVAHEWNFRQGYHKGFGDALESRAALTFRSEYPRLYRDRYQELLWESNRRATLDSADSSSTRTPTESATGSGRR